MSPRLAAPRCAALSLASAALVLALAGCQRSQGGSTASAPSTQPPAIAALAAVPLGDVAGGHAPAAAADPNPFHNQPEAVAEGRALFVKMNCAGCHGYDAKGAMGPNLTDGYWRYGGAPVSIFKSIYEGRPQGMPAWNPALPPDDIWKIVAYVESLGGSYPAGGLAASVQGDTPNTAYAPEVQRVLPAGAKQPKEAEPSAANNPPEARPDAGGKP
ncbi:MULTISPECIES: c-type cytochrome [Ramlibacter]|uniref:C-type cytochrome n=1 Tax=Ramlibacter aquaticus TaxID=2780094 RepID=A0ABR9SI72_9BURK|nr:MULTISPECIES: c-type cytochrome [Ramlibacter]MBE7942043.1 c-type cytochrome [Ramlibacter aquaticus]